MMDKETYEEAVCFARRVRQLSPSYGVDSSFKLEEALKRFAEKTGFSGDIMEELVEMSETRAWAWDILCDMVVRRLKTGRPDLPEIVCRWAADTIRKTCSRPRKGRTRPSDSIVIADTVHIVKARFGVKPTRNRPGLSNCCAEGGSACDIVGSAQVGNVRAYKTIEAIWGDYREYSETCWSEGPWEEIINEWVKNPFNMFGGLPPRHTRILSELGIQL